ncbi:MAG: L,D-transpeptidase family protein [Nitrospinae bacterium]|nr:L,D-transpeptidase family protein [Nitrospinota bacterium]
MDLRGRFDRWVFITETRLKVAYHNYVAERAFAPRRGSIAPPFPFSPQLAAGAAALMLLTAGGAAFIGRTPSVTAMPSIAMPVISNANFPEPKAPAIPVPLPAPPDFAIAVDKANKLLLVLKDEGDHYTVIRQFDISLGRIVGTKEREGDMRTPVGFYRITEVKDGRLLPKIYGPRVFVTNYPNSFDVARGRTGGGIWLHGSGQGKRTPDTHGCVVLDDDNVKNLEQWVRVNTPVAIFPDSFHLPVQGGRLDKKFLSMEFFYGDEAAPSAAG